VSRVRLGRIFWIGAAALLCVAALIGIVALLRGRFGETDARILGTLGILFLGGSNAIACLALIERRQLWPVANALLAATPVWLVVLLVADWSNDPGDTFFHLIWTAVTSLFASIVVATARLPLRERRLVVTSFAGVMAFGGLLTGLLLVAIWRKDEPPAKLTATVAILTALAYFVGPVVQRALGSPGRARPTPDKVNLDAAFQAIPEPWSPRIAAEVNGAAIKLARVEGEFVWHRHEREDEVFLVHRGRLTMRFREREVELGPGELLLVPRGVEHCPVADPGTEILLFEPLDTSNTGSARGPRTVEARPL
jgi:mannose-6-phosphate isomerase-like protein (cupin superfamily)